MIIRWWYNHHTTLPALFLFQELVSYWCFAAHLMQWSVVAAFVREAHEHSAVKNWLRRCFWFLLLYLKAHWTLHAWWCPILWNCGLSSYIEISWFCTERLLLKEAEKGKWAEEGNDAHTAIESIVTRERTPRLALVHQEVLATLSPRFPETSFPLTTLPDRHTPCGCGFLQFCFGIFCRVDKACEKTRNPLICHVLLESSMLPYTCLCSWSCSGQAWLSHVGDPKSFSSFSCTWLWHCSLLVLLLFDYSRAAQSLNCNKTV